MTATAQSYIKALQLQPHPEGGFFSESYRSEQTMEVPAPGGGTQQRNVCTAIYFLLEAGNFSAFHRIQSDEVWHFYAGQALDVLELLPSGELRCTRLGPGCPPAAASDAVAVLSGKLHEATNHCRKSSASIGRAKW